MKTKIHSLFANFIGQPKAVERLSNMFLAVEETGETKPLFIRGQSGLGKTHLLNVVQAFYEALGWFVIRVNCPSELVGEKFAFVTSNIREALAPVCVIVDEAHRFRKGARISVKRFHSFIMKATDKLMIGKEISVNDGEIHCANLSWSKLTFVLATNFASELEEAKGSTSFVGRFIDVLLEDYSSEDVSKILSLMIKGKGLRIAPETVKYIAACARGNARPLDNITEELLMMAKAIGDKATLNREEVINAIRLADLFPGGLNRTEVDIIKAVSKRPVRQSILSTQFPNVDSKSFKESIAFLQGESKGFIYATTKGLMISPDGERYLREASKAGFAVYKDGEKH